MKLKNEIETLRKEKEIQQIQIKEITKRNSTINRLRN